jgi:hypothetical protein
MEDYIKKNLNDTTYKSELPRRFDSLLRMQNESVGVIRPARGGAH